MPDLKISQLDPLGLTESVDVDNDIFPIAKNFGTEGNRQYTLLDIWLAFQNFEVNPFPQYALAEDIDAIRFPEVITYTSTRSSITADIGKYIRYDSLTDVDYSIDQGGTVWPFGAEVHIEQSNTGKVNIAMALPADGTVVHESIFLPKTRGQRAVITIKKTVHGATRADDVFTVFGGLEAVEPTITLTSSGGVLTLDLSIGRYFEVTLTENITSVVITGLQGVGYAASFMLWITQHAGDPKTVAFPASFDWDSATAETVSSSVGKIDLLACSTRNGGSSWDATLSKGRA